VGSNTYIEILHITDTRIGPLVWELTRTLNFFMGYDKRIGHFVWDMTNALGILYGI
jgi:hypothetical protein